MLKNFKLDKKKYKSNKQKISSYIVQDNDDVKFGEEKGKSVPYFIRIHL